MTSKPRLTPRKAPKQDRARATVDAILEAAARILDREGLDAMSTNRVADVAGVSIGSLYQYFPSKESILTAMIVNLRQDILGELTYGLMANVTAELDIVARALVRSFAEPVLKLPAVTAILLSEGPKIGVERKTESTDREIEKALSSFLVRRKLDIRAVDPAMAARALRIMLDALSRDALRFEADKRQSFLDEAAIAVTGYLRG